MKPTIVCCFSGNQGGMELMAFELAKLLSPKGQVYLVCRSNTFIHKNAKDYAPGIEIIAIPFKGNFSFKCISQFKKIIKEQDIKNVIFLGASELKSLYFACRKQNINFINFHGTTKTHSKDTIFHRHYYRVVNTHVGVSDHITNNVKKIMPHFPWTKFVTIYPPAKTFSASSNDFKNQLTNEAFQKTINKITKEGLKRHFHFLLPARIAWGKGHSDAIRAGEIVLEKGYSLSIDFAGNIEDQKYYNELLDLLKSSSLKGHVEFLGHIKNMEPLYEKNHFLLFPSYGEGLPAAVQESLLAKLLPITYDNTVFPEFLKMGFQFPQVENENIELLARAMMHAMDNYSTNEFQCQIINNQNLAKKIFGQDYVREEYLKALK